jgi:hypothetical protein
VPTLRNETAFAAELIPLIDRFGRNVATVVVKGTYLVTPGGALHLASVQEPIAFVDQLVGGALISPADLVDYKPAADVLVFRPIQTDGRVPLDGRDFTITLGQLTIRGKGTAKWTFGPLPRDQDPRRAWAGTYDSAWIERRMPLLPLDFDARHNQTAPPGQTIPYLSGDEPFSLQNVYSDGQYLEGVLPGKAVVIAGSVLFHYFTEVAILDTVCIWTDRPQITLVWRHTIRPKQKIEEVGRVHVNVTRLQVARELYGAV